jgi:hypothetical protein
MTMDRADEIAQLKHELDILRTRYALFEKWGRVLRIFFMLWVPAFAAVVVLVLVKVYLYDALTGLFAASFAAAAAAIFWFVSRDVRPVRYRRWIDISSSALLFPWTFFPAAPYPSPGGRPSDAQLIERQIAEREQRLAELDARP